MTSKLELIPARLLWPPKVHDYYSSLFQTAFFLESVDRKRFPDELARLIVVCATGVLFVVVLAKLRKKIKTAVQRRAFRRHHGCQPAQASALPMCDILGLCVVLRMAYNVLNHRFALGVRKLFDQYGTTHTARVLHRSMVNTIDPRNLNTIMKTRFQDCTIIPGREKLIRVLLGKGVFATDGEDWRRSRALVRAGMSSYQYDTARLEVHAAALIGRVEAQGDRDIDSGRIAFEYTFDSATDFLFGEASDEDRASKLQFAKDFAFLGKMARVLAILISQVPFLAWLMHGSDFHDAQKRVFAFVDKHVDQAQERATNPANRSKTKHESIVDGMAATTTDVVRVRTELLNLLLARHVTVGIALSELVYCLSREPEVWTKLQAEVLEQLQGRLPRREDLKLMPYLNHTINEAIRVRPTLSVHGRRATCDTVVPVGGGASGEDPLFVSQGTYVVYSNYALYRNPAVFGAEIDAFRPDRWASIRPATFEYLNFGAGPRFCPGKEMGWTMLAYVTVRLAQEVQTLTARDNRPWEEAKAFSFHNRHGVHVAATMVSM
ncbi:Putative cytochrome P450 [Septoria linicola]|uniref:Cytochrome P450 n=1 Tax=Septoria linicola TaxID=215465 RepID=A0A9Q9AIN5_9PEZI|nr:Putative cytochrome P450 [Septoria linicola]